MSYSTEPSGDARTNRVPPTADVRLDVRGTLTGQLVDAQGRPGAQVPVELWGSGGRVSQTVTDAAGRFSFAGLKAGVYQVLAAESQALIVRAWQPAAAPPAASEQLLLVCGPVLRGQYPPRQVDPHCGVYDGAVMRTLSNPWVFSGLIAAGIAVPIALANDDDDDREGS